jgi:hypothetical protein
MVGHLIKSQRRPGVVVEHHLGLSDQRASSREPLSSLGLSLLHDCDRRSNQGKGEEHRQNGDSSPTSAAIVVKAGLEEVVGPWTQFHAIDDKGPVPAWPASR